MSETNFLSPEAPGSTTGPSSDYAGFWIRFGASFLDGRAFLRWIGRFISTIPIFLGYFWMLWDDRKQCWHDKIANDVVVRV